MMAGLPDTEMRSPMARPRPSRGHLKVVVVVTVVIVTVVVVTVVVVSVCDVENVPVGVLVADLVVVVHVRVPDIVVVVDVDVHVTDPVVDDELVRDPVTVDVLLVPVDVLLVPVDVVVLNVLVDDTVDVVRVVERVVEVTVVVVVLGGVVVAFKKNCGTFVMACQGTMLDVRPSSNLTL
mmetsp:Transcript_99065/g.194553  ORF Transcript_99065/g.194553 Transcript_99065/m.194553 type:complete len:179 (-) Transcript_99065:586-1122(-)